MLSISVVAVVVDEPMDFAFQIAQGAFQLVDVALDGWRCVLEVSEVHEPLAFLGVQMEGIAPGFDVL